MTERTWDQIEADRLREIHSPEPVTLGEGEMATPSLTSTDRAVIRIDWLPVGIKCCAHPSAYIGGCCAHPNAGVDAAGGCYIGSLPRRRKVQR